jgi:hypothetical protein
MKVQARPYKLRPCKTEAGRIRQGKRICNANSKALEEMMKLPEEFFVDISPHVPHSETLEEPEPFRSCNESHPTITPLPDGAYGPYKTGVSRA